MPSLIGLVQGYAQPFLRRVENMGNSQGAITSDLCELEKDADRQNICKGCRGIATLLEITKATRTQSRPPRAQKPRLFHSSYDELDFCAQKCVTCRVFRLALLSNRNDAAEVDEFAKENAQQPVFARIVPRQIQKLGTLIVEVSIANPSANVHVAQVLCMDANNVESLYLHSNPTHPLVYQEIQSWIQDCSTNHLQCGNLRWSSRNPTRLLRVRSASEVQLIETSPGMEQMKYVALSYRWGDIETFTSKEMDLVDGGKSTTKNLRRRLAPFDASELPATIRDAVTLMRGLSLEYLWIDTVCIIQDDPVDWQREAASMHEVYSNALFTLCASSNNKATDGLIQSREAWKYPLRPCRLNDKWLVNFDVSIDKVRLDSPLAGRAWTLQEERLSPRILYWSAQRIYWSCSHCQHYESTQARTPTPNTLNRRPITVNEKPWSPQCFLMACRQGNHDLLHDAWLDVVVSYTQRDLSVNSDRFIALSGLASRYHGAHDGNEYLAGLWSKTFARDLCWRVETPGKVDKRKSLLEFAPSWSWASLPFQTCIAFTETFIKAPDFEFLEVLDQEGARAESNMVERGATVRSVRVRGRMRPLFSLESKNREWFDISKEVDGKEQFSFAKNPEQPVHSADPRHGQILAYEPRKQEILGILDYHDDAMRIGKGSLQLYCLEIGVSVMLLLEPSLNKGRYSRRGISRGYRDDFFYDVETIEVKLE